MTVQRGRFRSATKLAATLAILGLVAAPAYAGERGVQQSATGEGEQVTGSGNQIRTFAFSVGGKGDGTVSGEAQVVNPEIASDRTFELDCLTVFTGSNGSPIAVSSGFVTSAEVPALVGRRAIFAVQDNGEGAANEADVMTLGFRLDERPCTVVTSEASLIAVFPLGMFDIRSGNIQVRP